MKYIPNLIPKESKVLSDYFKEDTNDNEPLNTTTNILFYIGAFTLFIMTFRFLTHPLVSLFFLISGICLFPPMNNWIEKTMRFQFTAKIKTGFVSILLICCLPIISHYNKTDKEKETILLAQKQKNEKVRLDNLARDNQKRDSLEFYVRESINLQKTKQETKALEKLKIAETFITKENDQKTIDDLRAEIFLNQTIDLIKRGNYKDALPELDNLLAPSPSNSYLLYQRAICLNKTGKIQEAVNDLKKALDLGNTEAKTLYEKINPVKRRISYYVTRCCDGSTSDAKGRGACSHHGGVCDWNDPVYEEYRKY